MILIVLIGFAIVATIVIVDYEQATQGKKIHLILRPWLLLIIFAIASLTGQHFKTDKFEQTLSNTNTFYFAELDSLTNEIKSTNDFFSSITNRDSQIISAWKGYFNDQRIPTNITYAEMKGIYEITNIESRTNLITVPVMQTNFLVMNFWAQQPVLDFLQMLRVKEKLDSAIHVPITIVFSQNDTNAITLAKQIGQIFFASGFTNVICGSAPTNMPVVGVLMGAKNTPHGAIADAYIQLCHELNQPIIQFGINTNTTEENIDFTVATTTNSYNQKQYAPQRSQRKK